MKKRFIVSGLLALALGVSVRAAGVEDLLKEFRGLSTEQERSASELQSALTQVMEHLAPGLGSEDFQVREQAQSALQDVALRAGRPGADAEQSVLTDLLVAYSAADQPSLTRVWCIRMLEQMGGVAAVDALDGYLDDESDEIGDCARRALQRMPAAKAADVLRKRLNSAQTSEQKIGFMTALAWRGDREAIGEIQRFLKDSDDQVVLAAINSLAKLPDARAVRTLIDMRAGAEGDIKVALTEALLTSAEGLKGPTAAAVYRQLYSRDEAQAVRVAALVGLSREAGERALQVLREAVQSEDYLIRTTAVRLLAELGRPETSRLFTGLLGRATGEERLQILRAIEDLGEPGAAFWLFDLVDDEDQETAIAALSVIGTVGDASILGRLAELTVAKDGAVREAARTAMARLKGDEMNAQILRAAQRSRDGVRAELIRTLSRRGADETLDQVMAMVERDRNPEVQRAGMEAIAGMGGPEALQKLVTMVASSSIKMSPEEVMPAFSALFSKMPEANAKAEPVLAGIAKAGQHGKPLLMQALGMTGSDAALTALRGAVAGADRDLRSAAIAGMGLWPDARVAKDLRDLVAALPAGADRVAAFDGLLSAIGRAEGLEKDQLLVLYREVMGLAKSESEQAAALRGIASTGTVDGLVEIVKFLKDPQLGAAAAASAVEVAGAIGSAYPEQADAAMQAVLSVSEDDAVRTKASDVVSMIHRNADMVRAWRVSGPYMAEGKNGTQLFDVPFAPELDGHSAQWVVGRQPDDDGKINLNGMDLAGDNRVAYIWSQVFVPAAMEVAMGVGSDDGVKFWLNGVLVHQNNVSRGHGVGQDKVTADFKEGWNDLLLKVTNSGSDWAASVRLRKPDGTMIEGMRVRMP